MLCYKPDGIPAFVNPNGCFTIQGFSFFGNFGLSTFETQGFLLFWAFWIDLLLYPAHQWLHKDSEVFLSEIMIVRLDKITEKIEVRMQMDCEVVLCELHKHEIKVFLNLLCHRVLTYLCWKSVQGLQRDYFPLFGEREWNDQKLEDFAKELILNLLRLGCEELIYIEIEE